MKETTFCSQVVERVDRFFYFFFLLKTREEIKNEAIEMAKRCVKVKVSRMRRGAAAI